MASKITSPFILNDKTICFIAFLDVFSTNKIVTKKHKKIRTPRTPPPYLGLSPKFYNFLLLPLQIMNKTKSMVWDDDWLRECATNACFQLPTGREEDGQLGDGFRLRHIYPGCYNIIVSIYYIYPDWCNVIVSTYYMYISCLVQHHRIHILYISWFNLIFVTLYLICNLAVISDLPK